MSITERFYCNDFLCPNLTYWLFSLSFFPRNVSLTFTYSPLTLFKFNMYAAMGRDNPWAGMMGGGADPSDEDQDTIKTTLLETNPYLLALTVAVSLLHSVFEFLAFKNGKGHCSSPACLGFSRLSLYIAGLGMSTWLTSLVPRLPRLFKSLFFACIWLTRE